MIFCDNVEEAEADVLTLLARLAQFDLTEDARLSLVLASEDMRTHLLGKRLLELCDLRIELEPWSADEVIAFVQGTLEAAACGSGLFTAAAMRQLTELSGGIPRRVQHLAQMALIASSAKDLEEIDEDILHAVHEELTSSRRGLGVAAPAFDLSR